jgi:pimeloyl-ACP methyl ester carboxylesterase/DNA-binding CsgD family transcriptional regulator
MGVMVAAFTSEPQVRYFLAEDGTAIAYWSMGDGNPPLIVLPGFPLSHISREWEIPKLRLFYQLTAMRRRLVRFDWRGIGLSQSNIERFDIADLTKDLLGLINVLEVDKVAIFAAYNDGPVALNFAQAHPDRVSHLILWHSFANSIQFLQMPRYQALRNIAATDWRFYVELSMINKLGWVDPETAQKTVDLVVSSYPKSLFEMLRPVTLDVTSRLSSVEAETLVLHQREFRFMDMNFSTELATFIPNARLKILEGGNGYFFGDNVHSLAQTIDEFLNSDQFKGSPTAESNKLTSREVEILSLVAAGLRDKEIATSLRLTPSTVHRHIANLYRKIDVHGRAEATAFALREGIVT